MAADAAVFFGLWLQKPLQIAAGNPSGPHLADALARFVELEKPGPVLELGAGTGSLTRGLVRAGCPRERIIAIEQEPSFAAVLRRDFPGAAKGQKKTAASAAMPLSTPDRDLRIVLAVVCYSFSNPHMWAPFAKTSSARGIDARSGERRAR